MQRDLGVDSLLGGPDHVVLRERKLDARGLLHLFSIMLVLHTLLSPTAEDRDSPLRGSRGT